MDPDLLTVLQIIAWSFLAFTIGWFQGQLYLTRKWKKQRALHDEETT